MLYEGSDGNVHVLGDGEELKHYKYIKKIKTGSGWRYFYTPEELQSYYNEGKKKASTLKKDVQGNYKELKRDAKSTSDKAKKEINKSYNALRKDASDLKKDVQNNTNKLKKDYKSTKKAVNKTYNTLKKEGSKKINKGRSAVSKRLDQLSKKIKPKTNTQSVDNRPRPRKEMKKKKKKNSSIPSNAIHPTYSNNRPRPRKVYK